MSYIRLDCMSKLVFKCLQCGHCCKTLLKSDGRITSGLTFFSDEEKELFPKNLVSPATGLGWGATGPKHIIRYQLNSNICPHLDKNNICKIYDDRPLVCRSFPLISIGHLGTTIAQASDCNFVENIEEKLGSLDIILPITVNKFTSPEAWQAIAKINHLQDSSIMDHLFDAKVLWKFDLKSKKWVLLSARSDSSTFNLPF